MKRTFVIVDDHPLYRSGVGTLIVQELGLECAGEAADAQEGRALIDRTVPDLAIIDISLRNQNGLDLVHAVRSAYPKMALMVLSMHEEDLYGERALRAGARGYIMKHQPPEQLLEAVKKVLAGNIAVSDSLKDRLFERTIAGRNAAEPAAALTDREFEVFSLIGKGLLAAEIAERLRLSVKTVNCHQNNVKEKLGVASAAELRKFAVDWASGTKRA